MAICIKIRSQISFFYFVKHLTLQDIQDNCRCTFDEIITADCKLERTVTIVGSQRYLNVWMQEENLCAVALQHNFIVKVLTQNISAFYHWMVNILYLIMYYKNEVWFILWCQTSLVEKTDPVFQQTWEMNCNIKGYMDLYMVLTWNIIAWWYQLKKKAISHSKSFRKSFKGHSKLLNKCWP